MLFLSFLMPLLSFVSDVTYWTISDDLLAPLMTSINSNINAAVPYGLAIMGSLIGIHLLRRVIYAFF